MKKLKIAVWVALMGFLVLGIYQNQSFFLGKQILRINLWVVDYTTPEIYNLALFLVCFIAGLLSGSYFILMDRLKLNKKIKKLNAENESHLAEITTLQKELESLGGGVSELNAKTVVITPESQVSTDAQSQRH